MELKISESQLVNQICEGLLLRGYFVWRQNNISVYNSKTNTFRKLPKYTPKGIADILGLTPYGKFLAIEVKIGSNKQSDYQLEFEHNIKAKQGVYILARGWQDIEQAIKNKII